MSRTGLALAALAGLALLALSRSSQAASIAYADQTALSADLTPEGYLNLPQGFHADDTQPDTAQPAVDASMTLPANDWGIAYGSGWDSGSGSNAGDTSQSVDTSGDPVTYYGDPFGASDGSGVVNVPNDTSSNTGSDFTPAQVAAMQVIDATAQWLKPIEGYRGYVYDDATGQAWNSTATHKGNPTIGYGHLLSQTDDMNMTMDEPTAYDTLLADIEDRFYAVQPSVTAQLGLDQWVAVMSLVFNVGVTAFKKSKLLQAINAGDEAGVQSNWLDWNKARVTVNGVSQLVPVAGLTVRRQNEFAAFANAAGPVMAFG